jgi:hypothetical protein
MPKPKRDGFVGHVGPLEGSAPEPSAVSRRGCGEIAGTSKSKREVAVAMEPAALCSVFGVTEIEVARSLLSQLVSVLDPGANKTTEMASDALAIIRNIQPRDSLEAMTATMLVAAQHAALDTMRRALHPDQSPGGRALYAGLGLKAMRTYARLLEALQQGRGKGVEQRIIVERVTVAPGGQAVVGSVDVNGGGGNTR